MATTFTSNGTSIVVPGSSGSIITSGFIPAGTIATGYIDGSTFDFMNATEIKIDTDMVPVISFETRENDVSILATFKPENNITNHELTMLFMLITWAQKPKVENKSIFLSYIRTHKLERHFTFTTK